MIRVINPRAGLITNRFDRFSRSFGRGESAANHIISILKNELARNDAASDDLKVTFGKGDSATTAEKCIPDRAGVNSGMARFDLAAGQRFLRYVDAETARFFGAKISLKTRRNRQLTAFTSIRTR